MDQSKAARWPAPANSCELTCAMFLPKPPSPERIGFLKGWHYAHRGLHRGHAPLENSMAAFEAAIAGGNGIECDVQCSADGVTYVFHDKTLDRLTEATGAFANQDSATLDALPLRGGNGAVPRLSALLALVNRQVSLLIELKIETGEPVDTLCHAVKHELSAYAGPVAVMSFHPGVSRWFRKHAPEIVRGLVVTETGEGGLRSSFTRHLAVRYAYPDFLAYDIKDLPSRFAANARSKGFPLLSWTVRTAEQWRTVEAEADAPIYEELGEE